MRITLFEIGPVLSKTAAAVIHEMGYDVTMPNNKVLLEDVH